MSDSILGSFGWPFGPKKAVETSKEPKKEVYDVKFATETAADVSDVIEYLLKLHSYKNRSEFRQYVDRDTLSYLASLKDKFVLLKNKLNEAEKANPALGNLSIVKFCRSIAENGKLHKELNNLAKKCRNVALINRYERVYPQLDKMVKNFNMDQLQKQISFLQKLKEKNDFNAIRNDCSDEWDFDDLLIDLIGDEKFKAEYIDKALDEEGELFSQSFTEDLSKYRKLADQGKEVASKYFGEDVELQAYYTKDNILNVNLTNHDRNKPTSISDILQQEENTSELNIYCNKKHEVHARQGEDNKRHYEFKDGACYEMTSKWRVKDKSGKTSICTMIMNVSSDGITNIVEFNGGKSELPSEDDLKLVQQNHELHIQGCLLYDAVEKWLSSQCGESVRVIEPERVIEKNKEKENVTVVIPDVIPVVAGKSLQEDKVIEVTEAKQNPNDKGIDANQDFKNNVAEEKNSKKDAVKMPDAVPVVVASNLQEDKVIEVTEAKQNPNDKGIDANQDFENNIADPDVVPVVAGKSLQEDKVIEVTEAKQNPNDKGTDANQDFESSTIAVVCDALASEPTKVSQTEIGTQTEVHSQQAVAETQTEVNTQQIATQTEFHSQQAETQTEVDSSQMDELANLEREVSKLKRENVKLSQGIEAGLQVLNQKHKQEKQSLQEELKTTQAEKEELNQEFLKIVEFNKRVKHVNELLKDHVEKLNGEKHGLQEEKSDLQNRIKKITQEFEEEKGSLNERITNAGQRIVELSRRDSDLRGGLIKARQAIEKLEQQNSDLQAKDRLTVEKLGENSNLKAENDKIREELAKLKKEHEEKAKELDCMYEKKVKAKKDLGVLSQKNVALNSMVEKLKEELNQVREYAEYLMDEGSKAQRRFRSKMSLSEQNYEEKLKSSNEELEKKSWECGELQNDLKNMDKNLQSKKKIFEEAERAYRELEKKLDIEKMNNSMREGILQGMVEIRKDLEREIDELKAIIANKVQDIEALQEENGRLTEVIKIQDAGLSPLNPTDEEKADKSSMSNFKAMLTFTTGIGELISLSRSSSVESGLGSGDEDDKWRNKVGGPKNPSAIVQSS